MKGCTMEVNRSSKMAGASITFELLKILFYFQNNLHGSASHVKKTQKTNGICKKGTTEKAMHHK